MAIIAGRGALPQLLAEHFARSGRPYRVVTLEGVSLDWTEDHPTMPAIFEKPGRLFADLRREGCRCVTLAGAISRPSLKPHRFDAVMLRLAPRLLVGIRSGDDRTLRLVAEVLEGEGLELLAPHEFLRDLLVPSGTLTQAAPSDADRADVDRAAAILAMLALGDVGQAAVVAGGLCLGVETVQGTDALLKFVAQTADPHRGPEARGVLVKAPKRGQDWRMDLPAIGPDTVLAAAAASLAGIAVQADGVMAIGLSETVAAANSAGLFVWGFTAA